MIKKTLSAVLFITGLLVSPVAFAQAQSGSPDTPPEIQAIIKTLSDIDTQKGPETSLAEATSYTSAANVDPNKLIGTIAFLSERDAGTTDPRYGLMLSAIENKLALTFEKAGRSAEFSTYRFQFVARYLSNSLILSQDVVRCADPTAGQAAILNWQTMTQDVLTAYKALSAEQKENVKKLMAVYDTTKATRQPAAWVCRDGMDAVKIAMKKGLLKPEGETIASVKSTNLKTDASIDPYLKYVDDAAWQSAKKAVYDSLLALLDK